MLYPVMWADNAEGSHLVSPEELRRVAEDAGFEVDVWNDLTASSAQAMRGFLSAPPAMSVFLPGFAVKIKTFVDNLEQDRTRLIQAVLVKR